MSPHYMGPNLEKKKFQQLLGVGSTQTLVKIYNNLYLNLCLVLALQAETRTVLKLSMTRLIARKLVI